MPQSACARTTRSHHKVKQGVVQVPKAVRKFVTPDGQVLDEEDLTPEQARAFAQKIMDVLLVPLAYESVIRDIQREREFAAAKSS